MNPAAQMKLAQRIRGFEHPLACDRGAVAAVIYSARGFVLSVGRNLLPKKHAPCSCNDGTDTMQVGSKTCKAIHAEVGATSELELSDVKRAVSIAVTRPPCKECLKVLLQTNIRVLVTTNEYPDRDNSKVEWEKVGRKWYVLEHAPINDMD